MGEKSVDAGYSDIVEVMDRVAHEFGGDDRFFGYGDVAGSGGDYGDDAFAVAAAVALKGDGAGEGTVFGLGDLGADGFVLLFCRAGGQDVAFVVGQFCEDFGYLGGSFAFAEDHFGHALAEGTVVVELGEAEVFEREVAEAGDGFVGGQLLGADLGEKGVEGGGVHT